MENLYNTNTNLVFGNEQSYSRCFCKILEYIIECFCIERSIIEVSICIITCLIMIIICWKTNGNYMFPISAVAVVLWKIFHQCLRSWIILRTFASFLVTNFVPFRVAFYPNRMHSFDRFRYTFLDKNKRSFYSIYWFSGSYALCSPRLSSTKTRIKTQHG